MDFTHKCLCIFVVTLTTRYGFCCYCKLLRKPWFLHYSIASFFYNINRYPDLRLLSLLLCALTSKWLHIPCSFSVAEGTKSHRHHLSHHTEHSPCQCWPVITLTNLFSVPRLYFSVSSDPCVLISTRVLGCGFGLGRY